MRTFHHLLITGGCGFIGINLIHFLLSPESGFSGDIINIDKLSYASQPQALASLDKNRYHFIHDDICDQKLIEKLIQEFNIDAICHLAAESHVDRSINAPSAFMQSNVIGTFTLLESIRKTNPHIYLHHVSTDEVFGALADADPAFTENTPYHPKNPYSASKASSDHLVWSYHHTYDLAITMSHASNNYGYHQHHEKFIPQMLHQLIMKNPLPLYGKGNQIRDWMHVKDHVQAIWLIMQDARIGESYNIGADNQWRNIDLLRLLCKLVAEYQNESVDVFYHLITPVTDRLGHDYRYAIDATKIKTDLGWHPSIDFIDGLQQYLLWFISQH